MFLACKQFQHGYGQKCTIVTLSVTFTHVNFMTLVNNVKNSNIIYTTFIKITKENWSKEGWNDIPKLTQVIESGRKPGLLISIPVFYSLVCSTPVQNIHTQYTMHKPPCYQVVGKRNTSLPFPHTEARSPCIPPAQKIDSIPSHV